MYRTRPRVHRSDTQLGTCWNIARISILCSFPLSLLRLPQDTRTAGLLSKFRCKMFYANDIWADCDNCASWLIDLWNIRILGMCLQQLRGSTNRSVNQAHRHDVIATMVPVDLPTCKTDPSARCDGFTGLIVLRADGYNCSIYIFIYIQPCIQSLIITSSSMSLVEKTMRVPSLLFFTLKSTVMHQDSPFSDRVSVLCDVLTVAVHASVMSHKIV